MPYLALIDRLNEFLRQNSAVLIMSGYSFSDFHLNDTILNALRANPTAMVIALMFQTLTYSEEKTGEREGEKITKTVVRYEQAMKLAEARSNLSLWTYDEAIIGGLRTKWHPIKEFNEEENIGNAVRTIVEPVMDAEGKETTDTTTRYEFRLGDFSVLGDFLQELIGIEQFKLAEDGK